MLYIVYAGNFALDHVFFYVLAYITIFIRILFTLQYHPLFIQASKKWGSIHMMKNTRGVYSVEKYCHNIASNTLSGNVVGDI